MSDSLRDRIAVALSIAMPTVAMHDCMAGADAVIAELDTQKIAQALVAADSILSLLANRGSTWDQPRSREDVEKAAMQLAELRRNPIYTAWKGQR